MPNYRPCTHPQLSVRRLAEKGETQCPGCGASVNVSQWIDGPGKLAKNTDKLALLNELLAKRPQEWR